MYVRWVQNCLTNGPQNDHCQLLVLWALPRAYIFLPFDDTFQLTGNGTGTEILAHKCHEEDSAMRTNDKAWPEEKYTEYEFTCSQNVTVVLEHILSVKEILPLCYCNCYMKSMSKSAV